MGGENRLGGIPDPGNILAVSEFIKYQVAGKAARGPRIGRQSQNTARPPGSQEADFVAGDFEFQGVPVGRPVFAKSGRPFDEFCPVAERIGEQRDGVALVSQNPLQSPGGQSRRFADLPGPVQNQNPRGVVLENLPLIRTKREHPLLIEQAAAVGQSRLARMVSPPEHVHFPIRCNAKPNSMQRVEAHPVGMPSHSQGSSDPW